MNKKFAIVLALSLIAIVCCAGCIDPQEQVDPVDPVVPVDPVDPVTPPVEPVVPDVEYSVFFMLNYDGAGAYSAETVTAGDAVSKPATPTRSGYTFKGWFTAAEGGAEYDFTQAVNADLTLYAQWSKKSSSGGSSSGGHSHSYSWKVVTEPACTTEGQGQYVCSCGQVKSNEAIPATGHLETVEEVNAETGATEVKCKACGVVLVTIPAGSNILEIKNVEELKAFAETVNAGTDYSGKTVKLVYDLDLNGEEWTPIGTPDNVFAGTFDGNSKTIINLQIAGTENVGLFGVLYGTVKNLNIDGATITGNKNVGTIVGYGKSGSIEGCTVTGATITVTPRTVGDSFDDGDDAGGIVGFSYNGDDGDFDVTGCTVKDSTITAFRDVGGIAGSANGDDVTGNTVSNVAIIVDKVTNAYNRADIYGDAVLGRVLSGNIATQTSVTDWTVTIIYAEGFQSVQTETDSYYEISSAEGLGAFRDTVNAGETYNGKTVKLTADIDLENEEWTPIGTDWNVMPFSGTFDGQSNTISNLYINKPSGSNIGLFGSTTNGEIKNLKINNAKVTGRLNVGAVAGTPYTSKYTNIELTGHVEINGMAYVGGVGGKNAYADWTDITVDVDESSYVNANSIESGTAYRTYVGGVIGFIGEGVHTFKDITSNIDVIGTTCDVGGITGIAHYGTSYENCVCTGDVTITSATDVAESEEMGGIAGVWHNSADVTFTNCNFEGTLTANFMEGVDLSDNTITGKAYNENGAGKLIIDGVSFISVKGDDKLDEAIKGGNTNIILGTGNYIIPDSAQGKTLTIIGNGNTVIATQDDGSYEGCDYSLDGSTVTFKNIAINTDSSTYTGYARLKATYENCVITGTYTLYGDSTFIGCTFEISGDAYNIWTWGAPTATFIDCTFNSDGKALLLYGQANTKLTLKNCVFNDNGVLTDLKAAVEIGNDYGTSYELIANNVIVNGYEINDKGINTGSTLWGNKNSMGTDKLNVVVDGVDVY